MTTAVLALKAADPRVRELAALCLLMGLLRAVDAIPRDALLGMLEALVGEPSDR
ncbi:MAG: hypothetical protein HY688_04220 [Chloroflexi bacterium]|nr:hypothetical protein [Chloroflexota bacterium]